MDQRVFSFEYRKPRYANPTFLSSNVGFSLRAYNPQEPSFKNKITSYQKDYQKTSQPTLVLPKLNNLKDSQNHFSLPKIQRNLQPNIKKNNESCQIKSSRSTEKNNQEIPNKFYSQELLKDKASQLSKSSIIRETQSAKKKVQFFEKQQPVFQAQVKQIQSLNINQKQRQSQTTKIQQQKNIQRVQNNQKNLNHNPSHNLLKIIQDRKTLLNKLRFTQKDISRKQLTSYNIINLQPKQYDQTIKQYPKLTLQDRDEYFGRRFQKSIQDKNLYESRYVNINSHDNLQGQKISMNIYREHPMNHVTKNNLPIAGIHTYKMHEEPQIKSNKRVQQQQAHDHKNDQHFNMKLLNIVDEWTN